MKMRASSPSAGAATNTPSAPRSMMSATSIPGSRPCRESVLRPRLTAPSVSRSLSRLFSSPLAWPLTRNARAISRLVTRGSGLDAIRRGFAGEESEHLLARGEVGFGGGFAGHFEEVRDETPRGMHVGREGRGARRGGHRASYARPSPLQRLRHPRPPIAALGLVFCDRRGRQPQRHGFLRFRHPRPPPRALDRGRQLRENFSERLGPGEILGGPLGIVGYCVPILAREAVSGLRGPSDA